MTEKPMNDSLDFYASIHTAAIAGELVFNSVSNAIGYYRRANDLEHPQMTELDKRMCALLSTLVGVNAEIRSIQSEAAKAAV